ncbi:MAG TPA: hypothetical protein VFA50_04490 [Stellaceae bacterium]|nr:hypothetical protein [Stellaceae bacterium]
MRAKPMLVALPLTVLLATGATAGQVTFQSRFGSPFVFAPTFFPHRHLHRFRRFGFNTFAPFDGTFGFVGLPLTEGSVAAPAPGIVIIGAPSSSPAPSMPRPTAEEERPTVETTASGVTIIRGPGSHHLPP